MDQVLVEVSSQVATITLNRPERGNALNSDMVVEFLNLFTKVEEDPSVRIIVITGAGKFFCTGFDLQTSSTIPEELSNIFEAGYRFYKTINDCCKPVIAKINGPALGGGLGLVFTTDIRIALKEAYFSFPEIKIGVVPAIISRYIVPEIGLFKAKQYMLTGEKISAEQGVLDKFITCIVKDHEELNNKVNQYTKQLLNPPVAIRTIKKLVNLIGSTENEELKKDYTKRIFVELFRQMNYEKQSRSKL
ncbi:ClpP/crotonase-like domain-containing protein [Gigaspora rosea]|uniref:ClpP/crotonase-like domain-containing protein n=1 Tax=Gigaspora rosea TaxID=44941 RepID=A0A397VFK1_9GLOM|nr:ClpP/crotonase-like domain-containing protein [Gigaspora rosea]CAG8675097.1 8087_t:CDS:1 [Gigaspora rosea]